MKTKLFNLLAVGLLSLMFVSCENDKTSFSSESELNGNWVCIDEGKNFGVVYTFNNSEISYYRYEGGFIGDDNYYYYESIGNDLANGMTFKFEFDKQTQTIYVSGMKAGSLTRIDKDKVIFKEDYKYLVDGTFQRVKGVKSKSKADNGDNNNNDDDNNNTPNATNGALPGKFSVSATTQIQFSQGNLQYQVSTKTWRFAEQQYYYVGSENEKIRDSNAGWIDLFGWGTGNNPTLVSSDYDDYSTFTDWGVNKISNGGNKANQWRTLTNDEWEYLLNERANASSKKGHATVAGVHGYILLPDSWALPSELSFTSGLSDNWSTNVYTTSDWFKMEKAGAVFLSAAGYRDGTGMYSLYFVGYQGYYWSATPFNKYAYDFFFDNDGGWVELHGYRDRGRSVRLVH